MQITRVLKIVIFLKQESSAIGILGLFLEEKRISTDPC